jgi:membrane-bound metal-dependent hydrolase YbcI (DUF457 family)
MQGKPRPASSIVLRVRAVPARQGGIAMANFPTHIAIGTVVSGALATVTVAADMVAPENIVAVTLAGVLGSVLPDIDLKDSRPSRAMFAGLGVFFSFAVLFSLERRYSIAEMLVLWLGTLFLIQYVAQIIFHRFSAHRGIWHSIVAGLFCACVTALVYKRLLRRDEAVAWLAGGFMFIGYLTHLVLDEIYSVDVMDTRIKSSFGTALKIVDPRHPAASGAMVIALILAFIAAPPMKSFVTALSSRTLWSSLQQRLLPQETWFGAMAVLTDWPLRGSAEAPAAATAITTGSIVPSPKEAQPSLSADK